jgi:hypothetical protein
VHVAGDSFAHLQITPFADLRTVPRYPSRRSSCSTCTAGVARLRVDRSATQGTDVAEHIFRKLTGYTGYSREMSREILSVALLSVSAEDQAGYPQRLEAFAEQNRDRLTPLYRTYGRGGELAELDRSGLAHQPQNVVLCERIDTSRLWLDRYLVLEELHAGQTAGLT